MNKYWNLNSQIIKLENLLEESLSEKAPSYRASKLFSIDDVVCDNFINVCTLGKEMLSKYIPLYNLYSNKYVNTTQKFHSLCELVDESTETLKKEENTINVISNKIFDEGSNEYNKLRDEVNNLISESKRCLRQSKIVFDLANKNGEEYTLQKTKNMNNYSSLIALGEQTIERARNKLQLMNECMQEYGLSKSAYASSIDKIEIAQKEIVQVENTDAEKNINRKLEGEELLAFFKQNNIPEIDSISVEVSYEKINGVEFPIYRVKDSNNKISDIYEEIISTSLSSLAKVDSSVLQYLASSGTSYIFFSGYSCDKDTYFYENKKRVDYYTGKYTESYLDENNVEHQTGYYGGYCNSQTRDIVIVANSNYDKNIAFQAIVHETGHAFDFTYQYNNTDEETYLIERSITNSINGSKPEFFEIAKREVETLVDPAYGNRIIGNNTRHNYDFSLYSADELVRKGNNNEGAAVEYFADSFKNYFFSKESNERFRFLIPETFEFLDNLFEEVKQ